MTLSQFGYAMKHFWRDITETPVNIVATVFVVIFFAVIYYLFMKVVRMVKSSWINYVFITAMLLGAFATVFGVSEMSNGYYMLIPGFFAVVIIFVYSIEIKRAILLHSFKPTNANNKNQGVINDVNIKNNINEMIKAIQNMSKNDIGVLLVLSSGNIPQQVMESGCSINARISAQLIESIFHPKTPLHDGAMIISGNKIESAGCFLPLTQNENLPKELGTRHRAALGISETTDATVIVISEETGIISIVNDGKILRYADAEMLRVEMNKYYTNITKKGVK